MIDPLLVPRPYRVVDKRDESPGIVTLRVVPVDGEVPRFEPAQISMLGAFGIGEAAISVSSAVDARRHNEYTIRRAGPITNALADTPVGGEITVRGPFGRPWPLDDVATTQVVIVGGGLGIAPLRALVMVAVAQRERFDRLVFVYGAKTPDDLVFRRDFPAWRAAGLEIHLTVDASGDGWDGRVGFVSTLLRTIDLDGDETTAFVCGPDVMMRLTAEVLRDRNVPDDRIWVTLERNMQCGNALCGHCQLGPMLICRDGPVASYADIGRYHRVAAL